MTTPLYGWVTRQAERRPDAIAVVFEPARMTYGDLEATSNRLARVLRKEGCASGDRVCLLMPKSPAAIAAIVGVMKAGGIYVPLDPSSPWPRLQRIIASCEPRWILAAGPVTDVLEQLFREERSPRSVRLGWLDSKALAGTTLGADFSGADLAAFAGDPLAREHGGPEAAHILFTSGSTGIPKGVVVRHSSVSHFVEWANAYFGVTAEDRNSGHAPLHFDLSTYDIFGTLAAGAQLHLVPPELNLLPSKLAEFMRLSELTQWFSVPSVLNYLAKYDTVRADDFPALKRVLWCGEVLPTPTLIHWMKRLSHVSFTNLYGPTEATIASSYYTVPRCPEDDRTEIPIGRPCPGEELLVLNERLQPVAPLEIGDLYIGGVGLSPGYWNDQEKTRAVFLADPRSPDPRDRIYKTGDLGKIGPDGQVYFLGRTDAQIKSRGYRIELGEIEAALSTVTDLRESAVVAITTDGFEGAIICCAYVPASGAEITPVTLRKQLSKVLPTYMLPARWQPFERLLRNANGKIDRRALREVFERLEAEKEAEGRVSLKLLAGADSSCSQDFQLQRRTGAPEEAFEGNATEAHRQP